MDFSDEDVDALDWDRPGRRAADRPRRSRPACCGRRSSAGRWSRECERPSSASRTWARARSSTRCSCGSGRSCRIFPGRPATPSRNSWRSEASPSISWTPRAYATGGDHVERLGVERSVRAMEQADLVLAVVDISRPWDDDGPGAHPWAGPGSLYRRLQQDRSGRGRRAESGGSWRVPRATGREQRSGALEGMLGLRGHRGGPRRSPGPDPAGHQRGRRAASRGAGPRERAAARAGGRGVRQDAGGAWTRLRAAATRS